ncbi:hypothetical protein ALC60_12239, partial [Trachymyrmex zeteki]
PGRLTRITSLGPRRRPTTAAPRARAQSDSPLGFLRGVGERACTPCSAKPFLALHFTFRL